MRFPTQRIEPEIPDRSAGFLTKTCRLYLIGGWDPDQDGTGYNARQETRKRTEIKARTRHALGDFALLQEYADEDLKKGVINLDTDPPLFPEETPQHFIQGMLRFASEAATNEELTEYLFEAIDAGENDELDERSKTALEYAAGGNQEMYLRAHFQDWCAKAATVGISKGEAVAALERAWPEEPD